MAPAAYGKKRGYSVGSSAIARPWVSFSLRDDTPMEPLAAAPALKRGSTPQIVNGSLHQSITNRLVYFTAAAMRTHLMIRHLNLLSSEGIEPLICSTPDAGRIGTIGSDCCAVNRDKALEGMRESGIAGLLKTPAKWNQSQPIVRRDK